MLARILSTDKVSNLVSKTNAAIDETVLDFYLDSFNNLIIQKNNGDQLLVSLSYIDSALSGVTDTNFYLSGVTFDQSSGVITFIREGLPELNLDISSLQIEDQNDYVSQIEFSGGTLSLTRISGATLQADLQGYFDTRYLQSYTETDPTVPNWVKSIENSDISNWNAAYQFVSGYTPYQLPVASSNTLGGIKLGTGLAIDGNGIVSVTGETNPSQDTNYYVSSGSFTSGGTLSLNVEGYTTVQIDYASALDQRYLRSDNFINSASFSGGTLFLNRVSGSTISVNLDGRYLQSYSETDPTVPDHVKSILQNDIDNWNFAYNFVNTFSESDPTVPSHVKAITTGNTANWNFAYNFAQNYTVPSLQQVTDQGNTTTRTVNANSFVTSSLILENGKVSQANIPLQVGTRDGQEVSIIHNNRKVFRALGANSDVLEFPTLSATTSNLIYLDASGNIFRASLGSGFSFTSGTLSYSETDPTVPSHVKAITTGNISNWNSAYTFAQNYSVPNLQQVTTAGATTNRAITVSGLTSNDNIVRGDILITANSIERTGTGVMGLYGQNGIWIGRKNNNIVSADLQVQSDGSVRIGTLGGSGTVKLVTADINGVLDTILLTDISESINTDDFVLSGSFTDGILTLNRLSGGTISINTFYDDLDNRYLQSFTETDPTVPSHVKSITTGNISNWNSAYNFASNYTPYVLPVASSSTLGGIKLGTGLSIDAQGIVSVTGGTSSGATPTLQQVTTAGNQTTNDVYFQSKFTVGDSEVIITDQNFPYTFPFSFDNTASGFTPVNLFNLLVHSGDTIQESGISFIDEQGESFKIGYKDNNLYFLDNDNDQVLVLDQNRTVLVNNTLKINDLTIRNSEIIQSPTAGGGSPNVLSIRSSEGLSLGASASSLEINSSNQLLIPSLSGSTTRMLTISEAGVISAQSIPSVSGGTGTDTNDYVSSASFDTSNGILTINRVSGGTVTVDLDNRYLLSSSYTPYVLPVASSSTLGGIRIGSGLTIDGTGIVSVTAQTGVQGTVTGLGGRIPVFDSSADGVKDSIMSQNGVSEIQTDGGHRANYLELRAYESSTQTYDNADRDRISLFQTAAGTNYFWLQSDAGIATDEPAGQLGVTPWKFGRNQSNHAIVSIDGFDYKFPVMSLSRGSTASTTYKHVFNWDMLTDASVFISWNDLLGTGIVYSNILSIQATIVNNSNTKAYDFASYGGEINFSSSSTGIELDSANSFFAADPDFAGTSNIRGFLLIIYEYV